jgi:hypothetical protein
VLIVGAAYMLVDLMRLLNSNKERTRRNRVLPPSVSFHDHPAKEGKDDVQKNPDER